MSPNSISYQEILAYCTLMDITLNQEELKVIKLLDCWELSYFVKKQENKLKK